MDMKVFCNTMRAELAGWKARMYDIISHVETRPTFDRQYFSADVNALRALISEIDYSIRELKVECPMDFSVHATNTPGR